jgi:hypothetical protein
VSRRIAAFILTPCPLLQIAAAFWTVLLAPRHPLAGEFVEYLQEKGGVKAVTKDLWSMVRDFAQLVHPDFEEYEADGVSRRFFHYGVWTFECLGDNGWFTLDSSLMWSIGWLYGSWATGRRKGEK